MSQQQPLWGQSPLRHAYRWWRFLRELELRHWPVSQSEARGAHNQPSKAIEAEEPREEKA